MVVAVWDGDALRNDPVFIHGYGIDSPLPINIRVQSLSRTFTMLVVFIRICGGYVFLERDRHEDKIPVLIIVVGR